MGKVSAHRFRFRIQFLPARERRLDEVTSFNKPPTSRLMNELVEIIGSAFRVGGFWGALRPGAELTGLCPPGSKSSESWPSLMFTFPSVTMTQEVTKGGVYLCPATGGNYNHQRARYFGMYRQKCVEQIAEIRAVVDLTAPAAGIVRWNNTTKESKNDLIAQAEQKMKTYRANLYPLRCFLLGTLYPTEFRKDTKHGMRTSKQYFDIKKLNVASAEELAIALKGKQWRDFRD